MPKSIQEYVAANTDRAAKDLLKAANEVAEDRRTWSPLDKGRTVVDQVAECALLDQYTTYVLENKKWPEGAMEGWQAAKAAIAKDWETASSSLQEVVPTLVAAIRALTDDDLNLSIETAFGPMTIEQLASYPYWNMSYHQAQITYIGLLLA